MQRSFLFTLGLASFGPVLAQPNGPLSAFSIINHAVCGATTGSAYVYGSGGLAPYTYFWAPDPPNGQGTPGVIDVPPGSYTVTVTDSNADEVTIDVTIVQTTALFPSFTPAQEAWSCEPGCTGSWYYYAPLGGVSPHNVTFDPPGPVGNATPNGYYLTSLCPGTAYTVTVTDANGCTGSFGPLNVIGPMNPELLDSEITGSCPGGSTGSFTLTFSDADSVIVSGPNGMYDSGSANPYTATNLPVGMYTVWVSVGDGGTTPPGGSTPYCSTSFQVEVPESTDPCGSISGVVYADLDGDCIQGAVDLGLPFEVLSIEPGGHYTLTDANGLYSTELFYGNYALDPTVADYAVLCPVPVPADFTLDALEPAAIVNVAQDPLNGPDVWTYVHAGVHRPGFATTYLVSVMNDGPYAFTGLTLLLDFDPLLSVQSTTGSPTTPGAGELEWTIPALGGFASIQFQAVLTVPNDLGLVGTVMAATATVTPVPADENPSNDSYGITRTIVNAYDPNDKQAITSSGASDAHYFLDLDAHVDYTIRFQNTGTAEAINVHLLDTISPMFDITSLEILGASHAFEPTLNDRVLRFDFPNIMLPDSNANEPASHGFASFRLRPANGLELGETLTNAADIFFDFNPPIRTNTHVLTAEFSVGINDAVNSSARISPNPVVDFLVYGGTETPLSLQVLGADGRASMLGAQRTSRLDVSALRAGAYVLKVRLPDGRIEHHRFIKR